jgi:hypothetical protein
MDDLWNKAKMIGESDNTKTIFWCIVLTTIQKLYQERIENQLLFFLMR